MGDLWKQTDASISAGRQMMSSAENGRPLETNGRLNICRELINGKQAVKLDQAVDDYLIGDQLNFVNK
jgi:hypothetical protein